MDERTIPRSSQSSLPDGDAGLSIEWPVPHETMSSISSSREWNAAEYHRLSAPQFLWGQRVLGQLQLRGDERLLDAGCGTGKLTRILLENLPNGRVIGLDFSRNILYNHVRN